MIQIFCKAEEGQLFDNYLRCCGFGTKVWVLSNAREPFCEQMAQLIDGGWVWANDTRASTHFGVEDILSTGQLPGSPELPGIFLFVMRQKITVLNDSPATNEIVRPKLEGDGPGHVLGHRRSCVNGWPAD